MDKRITPMSHRLYNKGVIIQESSQCDNVATTWGFDMTSAYLDSWSFYVDEPDLNFMVTCFDQPMNIRELRLGQHLSTWYPISSSCCVSNPYLGNSDSSIMDG